MQLARCQKLTKLVDINVSQRSIASTKLEYHVIY